MKMDNLRMLKLNEEQTGFITLPVTLFVLHEGDRRPLLLSSSDSGVFHSVVATSGLKQQQQQQLGQKDGRRENRKLGHHSIRL